MTDQNQTSNVIKNSNINTNSNSNTNDNMRQSESPARTIDSHDSTTGSMNTIVDRSINQAGLMHATTIAQSTNANNNTNDSLTHSQASMLQQQSLDDEQMPTQTNGSQNQQPHQLQPQQQQQQQQLQLDTQSHIYSSPVYDQKPPLKLTAVSITDLEKETHKPKLITHAEFQKQLEQAVASRANTNTMDSRISKKQRFPPELIKMKDGDASSSRASSHKSKRKEKVPKASTACCSTFPLQIILGTLQLVLAISMIALGSLLIVRDASWTTAGCGIWTGLIAAITGSLGVISIRKTQTAFLALSLVCIATSTLALAIAGAGLSRDVNRMEQQLDLMNTNEEISAVCGLLFALFLHFIVSIVSVYRCAMQICAKSESSDLNEIIVKTNKNGLVLDQEKMNHYIKAMSMAAESNDKGNQERLAAMWLYAAQLANMPQPAVRKLEPPMSRPVMLIPAKSGNPTILPPPPTRSASVILPPPTYQGVPMPMPYVHPVPPLMYPLHGSFAGSIPASMPGTFRTQKIKSGPAQRHRRGGRMSRAGRMDANRRQRRKSEADAIDAPSYEYHGLDRAIADSFLAQQELSNAGSHVDYSSSSTASETYAGQGAASRTSSKTKIICRDVEM